LQICLNNHNLYFTNLLANLLYIGIPLLSYHASAKIYKNYSGLAMSTPLSQLAKWLQLPAPQDDCLILGASLNSRNLQAQQVFCAMQGSATHGIEFLSEAIQRGAAAVISDQPIPKHFSIPSFIVDNVPHALQTWASEYRKSCKNTTFIAITGSYGKTTTKQMLSSICQQHAPTYATRGNQNNQLGLPLTIINTQKHHRFSIVECASNQPGEIAMLTQWLQPNISIITNTGAQHLEGFGSQEAIIQEKSAIFSTMTPNTGLAIYPQDDPGTKHWQTLDLHKRTFSVESSADFLARKCHNQPFFSTFELQRKNKNSKIHLPLPGLHNVKNALAAIACAEALEIPMESIQYGLSQMTPTNRRLMHHQLKNKINVIDDSYNAGPGSFLAALQYLSTLDGERILVVAPMLELGEQSKFYHHKLGQQASAHGIDKIYAYHSKSQETLTAFSGDSFYFETKPALISALKNQLKPQQNILIKGSNYFAMHEVTTALLEDYPL
jgi:UDP-N-acetylmuramoyl-tripeptide--D-alanyl-D-alanine ligase